MKLRTLAPLPLLLLAATAFADTALYDIDAKNAKEIADAIGHVVAAQCIAGPTQVPVTNSSMCHVELLPTGQLLVEAPASSQAQVATVLKAIAARSASPTPRIALQYWVIYGEPGKSNAADASLKPLSAALQQLERVHGDLAFSVLDTATITAQAGTSAGVKGEVLQISENLRPRGDGLDLTASISFRLPPIPNHSSPPQSLSVSVTIKPGEFLVLGEQTTRRDVDDKVDAHGTLFYIVHWPQGR
jgi:hypothetical protein